jgi:hypothetical protein
MPPSKATLAKLNKLHYRIADGSKKEKEKAIKKADKIGYGVASAKRGIAHFSSKDNNDLHHVVTIKGTNPRNSKDLLSDVHLAIGKSGSDKQFKKRTNEIKKIYSGIDNNEDKFLTGHSLGGSIVTHAMAKSKSIRDNTKKATTFNAGYTPAFHAEVSKGLKSDDKKELKMKLRHEHQKGDAISAALTIKAVGKVGTQKKSSSSPHSLDNFHADKAVKDTPAEKEVSTELSKDAGMAIGASMFEDDEE